MINWYHCCSSNNGAIEGRRWWFRDKEDVRKCNKIVRFPALPWPSLNKSWIGGGGEATLEPKGYNFMSLKYFFVPSAVDRVYSHFWQSTNAKKLWKISMITAMVTTIYNCYYWKQLPRDFGSLFQSSPPPFFLKKIFFSLFLHFLLVVIKNQQFFCKLWDLETKKNIFFFYCGTKIWPHVQTLERYKVQSGQTNDLCKLSAPRSSVSRTFFPLILSVCGIDTYCL